jgi:hypothetical protein
VPNAGGDAQAEACATKTLQELFVWVEFAVFAGVVERDVAVGAFFALIDFATVERLGIDVNADGALLEFRKIQDLMNGFKGIDVNGMSAVHLVDFRGDDLAGATGGVFLFDAKILDFQPADGSGHPAILIAMIVDTAVLADFPADGHALEEIIFENEIAGVVALGEEAIFFEALGADGMVEDVVLDVFQSEATLGDGSEAFDPVGDRNLLDGEFPWHGEKIIAPKEAGEPAKKKIAGKTRYPVG